VAGGSTKNWNNFLFEKERPQLFKPKSGDVIATYAVPAATSFRKSRRAWFGFMLSNEFIYSKVANNDKSCILFFRIIRRIPKKDYFKFGHKKSRHKPAPI
jgi:hypothetical protein